MNHGIKHQCYLKHLLNHLPSQKVIKFISFTLPRLKILILPTQFPHIFVITNISNFIQKKKKKDQRISIQTFSVSKLSYIEKILQVVIPHSQQKYYHYILSLIINIVIYISPLFTNLLKQKTTDILTNNHMCLNPA